MGELSDSFHRKVVLMKQDLQKIKQLSDARVIDICIIYTEHGIICMISSIVYVLYVPRLVIIPINNVFRTIPSIWMFYLIPCFLLLVAK